MTVSMCTERREMGRNCVPEDAVIGTVQRVFRGCSTTVALVGVVMRMRFVLCLCACLFLSSTLESLILFFAFTVSALKGAASIELLKVRLSTTSLRI